MSPGHCPWYRGFVAVPLAPLEVGPNPRHCGPVLCWCMCACVCGEPRASPASGLSRHVSQSLASRATVCSIAPTRAACEGTSLRRWPCGLCGVHACACSVRVVRRRVRASTPSVAAWLAIGGESAFSRAGQVQYSFEKAFGGYSILK